MLGKRKREYTIFRRQNESAGDSCNENTPSHDVPRDVFQRYFEAFFEPLPESQTTTPSLLDDQSDEDDEGDEEEERAEESDWEGLSDTVRPTGSVGVVEHDVQVGKGDESRAPRQDFKSFMSSKPPRDIEAARESKKSTLLEEDQMEALNVKNDLALQRLLKESHLLEEAKTSSKPGWHRHKATDMRMQALGSKTSIFHQEKMPLSHRKGMAAKATMREARRRKDALENGVILEKRSKSAKLTSARRPRGVDVPAVGKFRGGTLKLTKKDIFDIQGPGRRLESRRGKR